MLVAGRGERTIIVVYKHGKSSGKPVDGKRVMMVVLVVALLLVVLLVVRVRYLPNNLRI